MKEKKYILEVTESQLRLIADCVEDCHRFAARDCDMWHTTSILDHGKEVRAKMREAEPFVAPELQRNQTYDWAGNHCSNEGQRKFIAQTYPIYREILHFFAVQEHQGNVYRSPTLTCAEGGELPIIKVKG